MQDTGNAPTVKTCRFFEMQEDGKHKAMHNNEAEVCKSFIKAGGGAEAERVGEGPGQALVVCLLLLSRSFAPTVLNT